MNTVTLLTFDMNILLEWRSIKKRFQFQLNCHPQILRCHDKPKGINKMYLKLVENWLLILLQVESAQLMFFFFAFKSCFSLKGFNTKRDCKCVTLSICSLNYKLIIGRILKCWKRYHYYLQYLSVLLFLINNFFNQRLF